MAIFVQVSGCIDAEGGQVVAGVPECDADYFAIYLGEPGGFDWQGDFLHKEHALKFARDLCEQHGAELLDQTGGGNNG